jgi:uncharacterized protein with PIN domain
MSEPAPTATPPVADPPADPGAGDPSPSSPPGIFSEGLSFSEGWYEGIDDPAFDPYRSMAAQFKDLPTVFKSLHDTKAALSQRQDGMVKLPGAQATPEEKAAFHRALGVPESVDDYQITPPEKLPEGVEFDEGQLSAFREFAHANGIPPATASALVAFQAQAESEAISSIEAQQRAFVESQQNALRQEWGAQWEKKQMLAKRAAETFGLGADHPAMQNADVVKAMAEAAAKISEDSLVAGEEITGKLSPQSEARDIMANPDNPLHVAYHDETHPQHEHAVQTYLRKMEEQARREGFAT